MKKLYKVETDKKICGVCGGIAEYFEVDSSLIRLGAIAVICLSAGTGVVAYIAAAYILPKKE